VSEAVTDVFTSILVIGLALVAAKWLRARIRVFRTLFLPASVIGGTLMLLVGPQVLGRGADAAGGPTWLADGLLPEAVLEAWEELPVLLISVVFAALFIGKTIPGCARSGRSPVRRSPSGSPSRGGSTSSASGSGCSCSPRCSGWTPSPGR
jgi:Na+/glutamate symporter